MVHSGNVKRVKRELVPYDEVFERDNETPLCLELTEQQIALLLSQTRYLYWAKRYVKDDGLPLTPEQREVILKAASALETVLASAEGCDMPYTIELNECNLELIRDGVTVSSIDLSECLAPPIHIAFDAANCRLMYTQGDIFSPYEGGDWITVLDWNMADILNCANPSQQPPKTALLEAEICDIAWGTAEQILRDVLYIQQYVFDATSGAPYNWAIDLLADASFLARQWWGTIGDIASAIGIANWIALAPVPDQGMLDTYASLEAKTLLATRLYCSMSIDIDGNIAFSGTEFTERMAAGFFSVNVHDAVMSYITANGAGDLLRNYFLYAAVNTTGSDCSLFDCYALPSCADVADDFIGGLGTQTRLFDASHAWGRGGGDQSGTLIAGGGIGGGDAIRTTTNDNSGGGGIWYGGFFIDLGRECDIVGSSFNWRGTIDAIGHNTGISIDYRNAAGAILSTSHYNAGGEFDTNWSLFGKGGYSGIRYVVFRGDCAAFAGVDRQVLMCNPVVDVS